MYNVLLCGPRENTTASLPCTDVLAVSQTKLTLSVHGNDGCLCGKL